MLRKVILALTASSSLSALLTNDCDQNSGVQFPNTCVPSFCTRVTNAKASDPLVGNSISYSQINDELSKLQCRHCVQSTQSQCKSTFLSSVLKSGGGGLRAVYCTDEFMVFHTIGKPNHEDGLADIPRPPGSGGAYESNTVTRSYHQAYAVHKIPLEPVDLGKSLQSNNQAAFVGQTDPVGYSSYGLPTSGAVSITVSGQVIFPLFNDQEAVSHAMCELDKCSAHAGKGFDYHYHGDPFSSTPGKCMYSGSDYPESISGHPPLIGWALDGFKIYGRHLNVNNDGQSIQLDLCGGHSHSSFGYHYHSQVLQLTTSGNENYFAYIGGVYQCWRGDINVSKIFNNAKAFTERADYHDLRPCCNSMEHWKASGIVASYLIDSLSPSNVVVPVFLTIEGLTKESVDSSPILKLSLRTALADILDTSISAIGLPTTNVIIDQTSLTMRSDLEIPPLNLVAFQQKLAESWSLKATNIIVNMTVTSLLTSSSITSTLATSLVAFTTSFKNAATANNYPGDLSNVQTLGVSVGISNTQTTSTSNGTSNPILATGNIIAIIVCGVLGLVIILSNIFGFWSCGSIMVKEVKASVVKQPNGNYNGELQLANECTA